MKTLLFFAALVGANAYAGTTQIYLDCQSASQRTQLEASIPGDEAAHNVTFTIDGKSLTWLDSIEEGANSEINVSGSASGKDLEFALWKINATRGDLPYLAFETLSANVKRTQNGERGTIRARVQALDPRKPGENIFAPIIELNCSYVYEI